MLLLALLLGCRTDEPPPCVETAAVCDDGGTFAMCLDRPVAHWLFDDGTRIDCVDDDCSGPGLVEALGYCGVDAISVDEPPDGDDSCDQPDGWFVDEDSDGWGTGEPSMACEPIVPHTVRNGLDCDDGDDQITGQTGTHCPSELVVIDSIPPLAGLVLGDKEFIAFGGEAGLQSSSGAQLSCENWAPLGLTADGHLVNFIDTAEYQSVLTDLVGAVRQPEQNWAAWLGIGMGDTGALGWLHGGTLALDEIPSCYDSLPAPGVDPGFALVWEAGADTPCIGPPEQLGTPYAADGANLMCERPKPNPNDYMWFAPE